MRITKIFGLTLSLGLSACGQAPSVAGPSGSKGDTGARGPAGATMIEQKLCSKLDISALSIYRYEIVTWSTGVFSVNCSVTGSVGQYSADFFVDDSSAICIVGADIDSPSAGYWQFTNASNVASTTYHDSGSTHDNYTYTFVNADCTAIAL